MHAEGGEELRLVRARRHVADVEVTRGAVLDSVGQPVREWLGLTPREIGGLAVEEDGRTLLQ